MGPSECIVDPGRNRGLEPAEEDITIYYREVEDLLTQIERHIKVQR